MAEPPIDWTCEEDPDNPTPKCFPAWDSCDRCSTVHIPKEFSFSHQKGLVLIGQGIPIDECPHIALYAHRDVLRGKYDVCPDCSGEGGGYICGEHDTEPINS